MSISEEYMSSVDAALALKIDRSRILVLCREGRFAGAAKIGSSWAIPRVAVEKFRRLPPGGRKNLKHQREEDREMIARALESTHSAQERTESGHAEIARGEE